MPQGLAFVLSAPAGTGKTTLAHMLTHEFPCVTLSVSFTTRKARVGEIPGQDYHFITLEEFERKIAENEFLEYVKLYGCYYGTSKLAVQKQIEQGKHVMLVIDTQGALQLMGKFPATFIFLQPPSMDVLRERLHLRRTEINSAIEERLVWAEKEIEASIHYDYRIINDNLEIAYQVLKSILISEEHKIAPCCQLKNKRSLNGN